MSLVVREIRSAEEREACYHVRMVVFVEEQGVPPWEELDADDEAALHVAAIVDEVVVGSVQNDAGPQAAGLQAQPCQDEAKADHVDGDNGPEGTIEFSFECSDEFDSDLNKAFQDVFRAGKSIE